MERLSVVITFVVNSNLKKPHSFYFIFYRENDDLIEEKPEEIDFTQAYTDAEGNVYCALCPRKWKRSQCHTRRHFKRHHKGNATA